MKPDFGYSQMRAVRHFQFLHFGKRQYGHTAEKPTLCHCKFVVIYMRYLNLSRLEFIASEKKYMNRMFRPEIGSVFLGRRDFFLIAVLSKNGFRSERQCVFANEGKGEASGERSLTRYSFATVLRCFFVD